MNDALSSAPPTRVNVRLSPSGSEPDTLPIAVFDGWFSATDEPDSRMFVGASFTFVTLIVNCFSNVSPPLSVTRTRIEYALFDSKSNGSAVLSVVPLIVNDDVALAVAVGAAGVHLGEDDADPASARAQLGARAIVGVSCYDSLTRAGELAAAGADYLAFGAFFPSSSKATTRRATPALLREAAAFGKPRVAIGGITPDNAGPLIDSGVEFLAAISGVFGARDIAAAAARYATLFPAST